MSHRMLVNFKNFAITQGLCQLFSGLSFSVHAGELVTLAGANGTGKSTLLQAIHTKATGLSNQDMSYDLDTKGELFLTPDLLVAFLPQSLPEDPGWYGLSDEMVVTGSMLESLRDQFGLRGANDRPDQWSEGERQKRAVIRTLLIDADLYLLDEPTNYLDIAGITAFEDQVSHLKASGKGVILVTHDRTLSDNLADHSVLLTTHEIYRAGGGVSSVWSTQTEDVRIRQNQSEAIRRRIGQLQKDMRTKAGWAQQKENQKKGAGSEKAHIGKLSAKMARRAKVAQRRAERELDRLNETKPLVPKRLNLAFPKYDVRNRNVFALQNVSFAYQRDRPLLEDVNIKASTRDKICLMGANGAGKSSLLRLIRQELSPLSGEARLNESVPITYLPQGLQGFFNRPTLLENFGDCDSDGSTVRRHLGAALIRRDKVHEPLDQFSNGELMRAAIVRAILTRSEFLILDEPTSHLDIESITVLEQMLAAFPGGFLLVSHDRTFVSNVADSLLLLDNGRLMLV